MSQQGQLMNRAETLDERWASIRLVLGARAPEVLEAMLALGEAFAVSLADQAAERVEMRREQ